MPSEETRLKKYKYWTKLWRLCEEHEQLLVVSANNVGSALMQEIRHALRGKAEVLMGKNTMIRAALKHRLTEPSPKDLDYDQRKENWTPLERIKPIINLTQLNVGFIFCKASINEVADIIRSKKTPAVARPGTFAPSDVYIKAGPTGLDPNQTGFFQAIGISTKIVKQQIEIQNDVKIIEEGKKIGQSEAVLLSKLNIKPFSYSLTIEHVYDNGNIFSPAILKISETTILEKFQKSVQSMAALSLAIGYPTAVSVPHSIMSGFKNLVSISLVTGINFPQAQVLVDMAKDPNKYAVKTQEPAKVEVKKEEKKEQKQEKQEEPEVELGAGGLFGEEEW